MALHCRDCALRSSFVNTCKHKNIKLIASGMCLLDTPSRANNLPNILSRAFACSTKHTSSYVSPLCRLPQTLCHMFPPPAFCPCHTSLHPPNPTWCEKEQALHIRPGVCCSDTSLLHSKITYRNPCLLRRRPGLRLLEPGKLFAKDAAGFLYQHQLHVPTALRLNWTGSSLKEPQRPFHTADRCQKASLNDRCLS
jgi:hypothetical protein